MSDNEQGGSIYILWNTYCNEVIAAIFLVALRDAGWRTKLVGLHGDRHPGRHGVTLVADMSLGDALRAPDRILSVIAPCVLNPLDLIDPDPRLGELFARAQHQQAVFVVEADPAAPRFPWPESTLAVSPDAANVLDAARVLIERLTVHKPAPVRADALP